MLASAARVVVGRPQLVGICCVRQLPTRQMRTSVAAAAGGSNGEQQTAGRIEQMSVNELQELLSNPVLVSSYIERFVSCLWHRAQWWLPKARLCG